MSKTQGEDLTRTTGQSPPDARTGLIEAIVCYFEDELHRLLLH